MSNSSEIVVPASCAGINLDKYNYTLFRSALAACNKLNGQRSVQALIAGFGAAAYWISLELIFLLLFRFKRRRTLYFWSISWSTFGTIIIATAHFMNHFGNEPTIALVLESIGWVSMVTGFAFVLYSRLHIVIKNKLLLRAVLIMIITDAVLFHTPVIIGAAYTGPNKKLWLKIVFSLEIIFPLQEVGLAGLYVFFFFDFVRGFLHEPETKAVLKNLVIAELVVLATDVVLFTLLYTERYLPREAIHPFCYAVKLKIEFFVLNSLLQYSCSRCDQANAPSSRDFFHNDPLSHTTQSNGKRILERLGYACPTTTIRDVESP